VEEGEGEGNNAAKHLPHLVVDLAIIAEEKKGRREGGRKEGRKVKERKKMKESAREKEDEGSSLDTKSKS
jgi:hypothetical protein